MSNEHILSHTAAATGLFPASRGDTRGHRRLRRAAQGGGAAAPQGRWAGGRVVSYRRDLQAPLRM